MESKYEYQRASDAMLGPIRDTNLRGVMPETALPINADHRIHETDLPCTNTNSLSVASKLSFHSSFFDFSRRGFGHFNFAPQPISYFDFSCQVSARSG